MPVICHDYITLLTLELYLCIHWLYVHLAALILHLPPIEHPFHRLDTTHSCVYPHDAPSPLQQDLLYVFTLRTYTKKIIVRTITTAIEALFTLIGFIMTYRTQNAFWHGICRRISHMKTSTCRLYMFYRDGALLFILWVQMQISSTLLTDLVQSSW